MRARGGPARAQAPIRHAPAAETAALGSSGVEYELLGTLVLTCPAHRTLASGPGPRPVPHRHPRLRAQTHTPLHHVVHTCPTCLSFQEQYVAAD